MWLGVFLCATQVAPIHMWMQVVVWALVDTMCGYMFPCAEEGQGTGFHSRGMAKQVQGHLTLQERKKGSLSLCAVTMCSSEVLLSGTEAWLSPFSFLEGPRDPSWKDGLLTVLPQ